MKTQIVFMVALGFAIFSCDTKRNSERSEDVIGAYVREYSVKVSNPGTGDDVGMRSVRDTIFVRSVGNGFEILNRKWRLNSYDKAGWQSMEHSEDRPIRTYTCILDRANNVLINEAELPIHLNYKGGGLYRGDNSKAFYSRIKDPRNIF